MRRIARVTPVAFCLAASIAACGDSGHLRLPVPTQPSGGGSTPGPAPTPAALPGPRAITVGEEVTGRFVGQELVFVFSAPRNGTLVARLLWDVSRNSSVLTLRFGETASASRSTAEVSPLVGRWRVAAGEMCRLTVGAGGTDRGYDETFVLTTLLE